MATKTKGKIAELAAKQLGITTRTSSATPEELQDIIDFMDTWAASQNAIGRRVGYNFTGNDPNTESGLPDWAEQGFWASVAVMMCPYFEKSATAELQAMARVGMATIYNETIAQQEVKYPNRMPVGTGSRWNTWGPRYYRSADRVETDGDWLQDEGGSVITTDGTGE